MFFVRGLSLRGREVLVNPDQVLFVRPAGFLHNKTALVLTQGKRLIVDQDTRTVRVRFEEYLRDIVESDNDADPDLEELAPSVNFYLKKFVKI